MLSPTQASRIVAPPVGMQEGLPASTAGDAASPGPSLGAMYASADASAELVHASDGWEPSPTDLASRSPASDQVPIVPLHAVSNAAETIVVRTVIMCTMDR